jgi:8-amino-7-oxononanoate synthase
VAAAAIAALDIVQNEPERRAKLLNRAANLRRQLAEQGWNLGRSASQIVPIYVGDPKHAVHLSQSLRQCGFFVPGIRPPSVPEGESLLRISLSLAHTPAMLEALSVALANCRSMKTPV